VHEEWQLIAQNNQLHQRVAALESKLAKLQPTKDPAALAARATVMRELLKLLPRALRDAKARNSKPALLRLIVRSLKSL
jgi:hypothetical protein